jgi:hypothetical protein
MLTDAGAGGDACVQASSRMLTYAYVCIRRMLTYADVCIRRMQELAAMRVFRLARVCCRMHTYAYDVC